MQTSLWVVYHLLKNDSHMFTKLFDLLPDFGFLFSAFIFFVWDPSRVAVPSRGDFKFLLQLSGFKLQFTRLSITLIKLNNIIIIINQFVQFGMEFFMELTIRHSLIVTLILNFESYFIRLRMFYKSILFVFILVSRVFTFKFYVYYQVV